MIISNNPSNSRVGQGRERQLSKMLYGMRMMSCREQEAGWLNRDAAKLLRQRGAWSQGFTACSKNPAKTHSGTCGETCTHYYAPSSYHRKPSGLRRPINLQLAVGWATGNRPSGKSRCEVDLAGSTHGAGSGRRRSWQFLFFVIFSCGVYHTGKVHQT